MLYVDIVISIILITIIVKLLWILIKISILSVKFLYQKYYHTIFLIEIL